MKNLYFLIPVFALMIGCSPDDGSGGIFDMLPDNINTFGNFFQAWLAILIIGFFLSLFVKNLATIILFFIVLFSKDYGFLMTILLFICDGLILFLINFIRTMYFSSKR